MIHPSTKKLIDKLGEMTAQRKISWAEGEDGSVVYDTEGYRVSLAGSPTEVILADALGKELDKADHGELTETIMEDGTSYAAYVAQLHKEAGRIARGAEHAIDAVLAGLDLDGDGIPDVDPEIVEDIAAVEDSLPDVTEIEGAPELEELEPVEEVVEAAETHVEAMVEDVDPVSYSEDETDVSQAVKDLANQVNQDQGPASPTPQPFTSTFGNYGTAGIAVGTAAVAAGLGMGGDETAAVEDTPVEPEPFQPTQIIPDDQVSDVSEAAAEIAQQPLSDEEQNIANILDTVVGGDTGEADPLSEPGTLTTEVDEKPSYLSQVSVFDAPIATAKSAVPAIGVSGFGAIPETVMPKAEAVADTVGETVEAGMDAAQDGLSDMVGGAADMAGDAAGMVGDAAGSAVEAGGDAIETVTDAAGDLAEAGTAKVGGMLGGIGGAIGGALGSAKDKAQGALDAVTDKVEDEEVETDKDGKPKPRFNPWR